MDREGNVEINIIGKKLTTSEWDKITYHIWLKKVAYGGP